MIIKKRDADTELFKIIIIAMKTVINIMKKRIVIMVIVCLALCLINQKSTAQDGIVPTITDSIRVNTSPKWSVEVRAGLNFPLKRLGDANLDIGYGYEGTVSYEVFQTVSTYIGWGFAKFTSDKTYLNSKLEFEESGFTFGFQHINKISDLDLYYMIKLGLVFNKIVTVNTEGIIINDTRNAIGWQTGVGIAVPLGSKFRVIPELRYRALSRNITIEGTTYEAELQYLSISLGFAFLF